MSDLATLSVPGPTVTPLTQPFWDAVADGRLLIQRCGACGAAVFYPRQVCPRCWSEDLAWVAASGKARLKSYSTVFKPGHPGWADAAPYVVGLVELEEGPTMLTHILVPAPALRVGVGLVMRPTDIGGRVLPAFGLENE